MKMAFNQKTTIKIEEFGWKTHELPDDPLSDENKSKVSYDRDLAERLLEEWGCGEVTIDSELERADRYQDDNWKAYSIWSFIHRVGQLTLNSALSDALSSQYEEIFSGFPTIGGRTSETSRVRIYRDPKSKGTIKLSNASRNIPAMQVEATPEINLEDTVESIRNYARANWEIYKTRSE